MLTPEAVNEGPALHSSKLFIRVQVVKVEHLKVMNNYGKYAYFPFLQEGNSLNT